MTTLLRVGETTTVRIIVSCDEELQTEENGARNVLAKVTVRAFDRALLTEEQPKCSDEYAKDNDENTVASTASPTTSITLRN